MDDRKGYTFVAICFAGTKKKTNSTEFKLYRFYHKHKAVFQSVANLNDKHKMHKEEIICSRDLTLANPLCKIYRFFMYTITFRKFF